MGPASSVSAAATAVSGSSQYSLYRFSFFFDHMSSTASYKFGVVDGWAFTYKRHLAVFDTPQLEFPGPEMAIPL